MLDALNDLLSDDERNLFRNNGWTIRQENAYLRELLDWESAPMKPIRDWFDKPPIIINPKSVDEETLSRELKKLLLELKRLNIEFIYVDHLSDRRLYEIIVKLVLPIGLKFLPNVQSPCYWNCCPFMDDDNELPDKFDLTDGYYASVEQRVWLTYYATDSQRMQWEDSKEWQSQAELPPKITPMHRRDYLKDV